MLDVRVNYSRKHPTGQPPGQTPGIWKNGQMPGPAGPAGNFRWQIPRRGSYYDDQMARPPSPSDQ